MPLPLKYHWRNLFVRKVTTTLTVLVIAVVVGTLTWILGFTSALRGALAVAADARKVIVLQRGANSETNSSISPEEFNRLSQLSGVEIISPELYWQTQLPRLRDGGRTRANVALRGVTEAAFQAHPNVRLLGANLAPGEPQVLVGQAAAEQFQGLEIGASIPLGIGENRQYRVVGYFSAGGGPMESEIWLYLPSMQSAYQRNGYSSATLRLAEGVAPGPLIEQIGGAAIQLGAQTEREYWSAQTGTIVVYQVVCYILVGMMSLAAVFAIANTMFAMVSGRAREVAMLRTIGYQPRQILTGFVLESVLLSLLGGVLGVLGCAAWLTWVGRTKDMFGANTFTTMAFEIELTPWIAGIALAAVAVVGALGALAPARRAARLQVVAALREA